MKVSLNWLKDFVEIEYTPAELADMLTMAGLEVEGIEHRGYGLDTITVSRILDILPHPNADRLAVCKLDVGNKEVSVVCGAPNIEKGMAVPLALPGTALPDGTRIKESTIRGEVSCGMLLAEDEMSLTDDHTGIMVLPENLIPGEPLSASMDLEDWIFEIGITPNRIDCASVIGVAREIGARTKKPVIMPDIRFEVSDKRIDDLAEVSIIDPDGCPRYSAGLAESVTIGPSPFWMRYRLHTSGIRAINNVVDITNYVLLELGQPLHAFDYYELADRRILVKLARFGDVFTTLDGQDRDLNNETLMICDGQRQVAIAGIMGGLNSEITEGTNTVLIESAYFNPTSIRRSSKWLSLATEASYRFERGIDLEGTAFALKRSLALIARLAGGKIAKGVIDCYPNPWSAPEITLRVHRANAFLGIKIEKQEIADYLASLNMEVADRGENLLSVKPPAFRGDITREVDLFEEIARLVGYDAIPVTLPQIKPTEEEQPELVLRDRCKTLLAGLGFTEVITYSFVSPESADFLGAQEESDLRAFVRLRNPLSQEQSVMRTSLIPGLLATVRLNTVRGQTDLRIFEWGKVYIQRTEELPHESNILATLVTGLSARKTWHGNPREFDFYDIKGVAESILEDLCIPEPEYERTGPKEGFDPYEFTRISSSDTEIGTLGKVSKEALAEYDLETSVYILELDIDALLPLVTWVKQFTPLAKYPAVRRDISVIVGRTFESAALMKIIKGMGKGLIESVDVFDVYQGKQIDPSEKALAISMSYRSNKRTLTDDEVNTIHEEVISEIRRQTGGRLRDGPPQTR
jgi:phenylalanyl-tRNA synthetase beta chain